MNRHVLAGAMAAAMVAIAPALAQAVQPAPNPAPGVHIQRAPLGGRVHTRAEVGSHVQALFGRLDGNRDGFITRAESRVAKAGRGDRAARRLERRRSGGPEPRLADRAQMFERMDSNRDGMISRDEFARGPIREERRMVIRGGQGEELHVRELGGGNRAHRQRGMRMGGLGLRGRMFDMADSNRDGRVSLQEATTAAYRHFDTADVNRDGRITPDERTQMRQRIRIERQAS